MCYQFFSAPKNCNRTEQNGTEKKKNGMDRFWRGKKIYSRENQRQRGRKKSEVVGRKKMDETRYDSRCERRREERKTMNRYERVSERKKLGEKIGMKNGLSVIN